MEFVHELYQLEQENHEPSLRNIKLIKVLNHINQAEEDHIMIRGTKINDKAESIATKTLQG